MILIRIETNKICAGIYFNTKGICIGGAPVFKRFIGKKYKDIYKYYQGYLISWKTINKGD